MLGCSPKSEPEQEDSKENVTVAPTVAPALGDNRTDNVDVESTKDCLIKKGFILECKPDNVTQSNNKTILLENKIKDIYSDSAGNVRYKNNNEEL